MSLESKLPPSSEDILNDSLEFLGGPTAQDNDTVQYGPLSLSVAPKEGKANTLLADHLFSPSFFFAERIERKLLSAPKCTVIELGAGAALPSLLLSTQPNPPSLIVITDYPDDGILGNLFSNVKRNREYAHPSCTVHALGYAWGTDPQELLDLLPEHKTGYDTMILSDLVHLDSFHDILLKSISLLLSKTETARLHVAAGKYTQPHVCDMFLTKAKGSGLILEEWKPKPDEKGWLGSLEVSDLDHDALALRKDACRYWIGYWEQQKSYST
ncbi:hypothetical protein AGABI1DRAFT_131032 [Agaricus bisporus var. burnettii JB137-S8]|uniref:Nicotinamide N-methyltransferase n=1 Tax=Agaricus bisporus var. burnettii (strain JB137-S8 / ATCC MYA-4627 / FGSC 10392) TaxID=597362 RepID=K5X0U6_AGABU|nr:uncharacterized protein AGABI1DRAFT_131032 [Agaricus bisporus var. burnettii JB137-S8]EKM76738.1 hypothetical protein AGABI1DRAFT_131032 [Agaricus bisporus var. burnettii JB137-S8]